MYILSIGLFTWLKSTPFLCTSSLFSTPHILSSPSQAKKAGELALRQIRLAQLMRDPVQESKCWLYYAEDCIGVGMLRVAARIIRKQHAFAGRIHNETVRTKYGLGL